MMLRTACYRPQRSWAKVMFLQVCVILFTGGVCLSACWDTTPPREQTPLGADTPGADTPPRQTPPQSRPSPWEQTPPQSRPPLGADPPGSRPPPPREADSGIRSTSGRYASYWNVFLYSTLQMSIGFFTNTQSWQYWHYCQLCIPYIYSFLLYFHHMMLANVKLIINGNKRIKVQGC